MCDRDGSVGLAFSISESCKILRLHNLLAAQEELCDITNTGIQMSQDFLQERVW